MRLLHLLSATALPLCFLLTSTPSTYAQSLPSPLLQETPDVTPDLSGPTPSVEPAVTIADPDGGPGVFGTAVPIATGGGVQDTIAPTTVAPTTSDDGVVGVVGVDGTVTPSTGAGAGTGGGVENTSTPSVDGDGNGIVGVDGTAAPTADDTVTGTGGEPSPSVAEIGEETPFAAEGTPLVSETPFADDGTFGADPSVSPAAEDVCFPGSAMLEIEDGSVKRMKDVVIGDRVKVAEGMYSEVFMFTHKDAETKYEFVMMTTESGRTLRATKSHYIPVGKNNELVAAGAVKNGDVVTLGNGETSKIVMVKSVIDTGLFNPQTLHGNIVVDGVVASTYTRSVQPKVAEMLLAPLKAAYGLAGFSTRLFEKGSGGLVRLVPRGGLRV